MAIKTEDIIKRITDELEDNIVNNWNIQIYEYEKVINGVIKELNKRYNKRTKQDGNRA